MCGIAGYIGFDDDALLRRMCASIVHRGPDADGFYAAPGVGLCMRRLAVIDLSTGQQPITNESHDLWVVFNGEIYNYQELTASLKARGHRFTTSSDTETIVHLYEDHGLDFVQHLRGMFAIALWDVKRRRLVLARDRIGEKPLYYRQDGPRLLFASEIKAILQAGFTREVNRAAVCQFLACGYVPYPQSFYAGIQKLPPGHLLVCEEGQMKTHAYWRLDPKRWQTAFAAAAKSLRDDLVETVRGCLKSDVEVGVFLSGGIDSSILAALMAENGVRPQSFTVGYDGAAEGFNELNWAARVARQYSSQHHELILAGRSTVELLPRILWHYDEPHGEPTSILVYQLCEFTRQRVKVAIGGTGGDEVFCGYPRHKGIRYLQFYRMLPRFMRKQIVERIVAGWPESTTGNRFAKRVKRFIAGSDLPADEAYLTWVSLFGREVRASLLSADTAATEDPYGEAFLREHLLSRRESQLLDRATRLDVLGYLPEYQLTYMDRMSMAHGLEVRSPLCDYRLVEFALSLPPAHRLRGSRSKHILKHVAAQWLPPAIIDRSKVGFDSPIGQWIKGELHEFTTRFLSREHVARSGLLNPDGVQQLLADHLTGRRDYSLQIWSVVSLEAWYRMYIEDGVEDGRSYQLADLRGAAGSTTRQTANPASSAGGSV